MAQQMTLDTFSGPVPTDSQGFEREEPGSCVLSVGLFPIQNPLENVFGASRRIPEQFRREHRRQVVLDAGGVKSEDDFHSGGFPEHGFDHSVDEPDGAFGDGFSSHGTVVRFGECLEIDSVARNIFPFFAPRSDYSGDQLFISVGFRFIVCFDRCRFRAAEFLFNFHFVAQMHVSGEAYSPPMSIFAPRVW